jgi:hypothetical protein
MPNTRRDEKATVLLPWYKIQEDIGHLEVDLLFVFDCCFAGQAAREPVERLGKLELLAAAPMGSLTQGPGSKSFTSALIRGLTASYNDCQAAIIQDIHSRLLERTQGLWSQALHVNFRPSKKSIKLDRLSVGENRPSGDEEGSLSIPIVLRSEKSIRNLNIVDFVQWLGEDRPKDFTSAKVLETTVNIEAFMQQMGTTDPPLKQAMRPHSMDNVFQAWDRVLDLTEQCSALQNHAGRDVSALRSRAEVLLSKLANLNEEFTDTLERSVISVDTPEDDQIVGRASTDLAATSLGVLDSLKLRQIIFRTPVEEVESTFHTTSRPSSATLIEEKVYDGHFTQQETADLKVRIKHLAVILGTPKSSRFLAMTCCFSEHKVFQRRFLLHFEVPEIYDPMAMGRLTLSEIIETVKGAARPSLEERFKIAHSLTKAILEWHAAGWVHQGISSPNIKFFRFKADNRIDYAHPYLLGFEFSRPDTDPSIRSPTEDPYVDVYRHPKRQGLAREGHQKVHDYYSLGVVLLEIGLWQSAVQLTSTKGGWLDPYASQRKFQTSCKDRLRHFVGESYQRAVQVCLSGNFNVELDDSKQSRLLNRFHELVVKKIGSGIKIA